MKTVALHGFLGQPADWAFLSPDYAPSLYSLEGHSLCEAANAFNQQMINALLEPGLLIGYSLGGRLALHCCVDNPLLWKGAVIISAHPGLENKTQRLQRQQSDESWAARFEQENWEMVMQAWNSQSVLQSSPYRYIRHEKEYNRAALSALLRHWSLAKQESLREHIESLPIPILWIVGEKDVAYVTHTQQLNFSHLLSKVVVVADAGHRVLFDTPQRLLAEIDSFRSALCQQQPVHGHR